MLHEDKSLPVSRGTALDYRINDVVIEALRGVTLAQMLSPPPPDSTARRIDMRLAQA